MQMSRPVRATLALAASLLLAEGAEAQVFTPTYMSPVPSSDVGIYVADAPAPGDLGVEGIWRSGPLGLRVGYLDTGGGAATLGAELKSPLALAGAPIRVAFAAGAQALLGDGDAVGLHGGLTLGHTFVPQGAGFTLTPYLFPRIALVDWEGGDGFESDLLAELGFEAGFAPNLTFRFGAELGGEGPDWGVGFAWRR